MATSAKKMRIPADRWFFGGMALVIIAVTLSGFAPSFFLRGIVEPRVPLRPMSIAALSHGLAATTWLALFAAQVSLVSMKRLDVHRSLASLGLVLTTAVVLTGIATVLTAVQVAGSNGRLAASLMLALFEFALFLVLVLLSLRARKDAQTHKRLMLFAAIGGALPSAISRFGLHIPFGELIASYSGLIVAYLTAVPLILAVMLWDYARFRKLHNGTLLGAGVTMAFWAVAIVLEKTSWWAALGAWTGRTLAAA